MVKLFVDFQDIWKIDSIQNFLSQILFLKARNYFTVPFVVRAIFMYLFGGRELPFVLWVLVWGQDGCNVKIGHAVCCLRKGVCYKKISLSLDWTNSEFSLVLYPKQWEDLNPRKWPISYLCNMEKTIQSCSGKGEFFNFLNSAQISYLEQNFVIYY